MGQNGLSFLLPTTLKSNQFQIQITWMVANNEFLKFPVLKRQKTKTLHSQSHRRLLLLLLTLCKILIHSFNNSLSIIYSVVFVFSGFHAVALRIDLDRNLSLLECLPL